MNPRLSLLVLVAALMVSVSLALSIPASNPLSNVAKNVSFEDPDWCPKITHECFLHSFFLLSGEDRLFFQDQKKFPEVMERLQKGPACVNDFVQAMNDKLSGEFYSQIGIVYAEDHKRLEGALNAFNALTDCYQSSP